MPGTHFKNDSDDSDQTGSQPRSSFIVRSSVRSFVRSVLIRVVLFKLSIVYRLSSIWHPTHPTHPTLLRSLRPRVVYLAIAHPSAADIATLQSGSPYQRSRVIMIRVRRRRAVGSEKAKGRTNGEGGYGTRDTRPGREKEGPER